MTDEAPQPTSQPAGDLGTASAQARVQFVGTGPGDPNLLTLRAVDAINRAQVIVISCPGHRILLGSDFLNLRPDVRIVSAGGADEEANVVPGTGSPRPVEVDEYCADTTAAIINATSQGLEVVRLVNGDPFLDGDISAEAAAVARADRDVDVVPGVTGMTAVPEYAGLTLHGHDVQLVGNAACQRDVEGNGSVWSANGLIVVNTSADRIKEVVEHAVASGRSKDEPAALICRGATTQQTTYTTTLGELPRTAKGARLADDESIHIAIGKVVEAPAREELDWYESKPLFGWSILIPRTRDHSATLPSRLQSYGAHSLDVPTISMEPPRTPQQMDKAIRGLVEGRYEWVVFTSANAVRAVSEKLEQIGLDTRAYSGLRIAAIFDSTVNALAEQGVRADLVPSGEQSTRALAAVFPAFDDVLDPINRVFVPRADIATESLSASLSELGWEVEDVVGYRTVRAAPPPAETREAIKTGKFDAVVFTSSTTVRNLVGIAGKPHKHTVVAAVGMRTAETCREHGLTVDVIAPEPTAISLADALADFAAKRRDEMVANGLPVVRPSQRKRRGRRPSR
ncbi:uroporphyrinogen-III synthase [Cutibacterium sp.]|uniref:uroporphyrinogen-III synthase n=1 Tax=Cutibacterium sp. TaxID=1912221 RepID=UPI0026DB1CFF|nr:uroporphyrinogen-III synthase [Cutibacterium sp.]MDO4412807.1 uroporphyrinogen-III synthase [Cutibacterium sp.]